MKRVFSVLLVLTICLGLMQALPMNAKAEELGFMDPKTIAADPNSQDIAFIKEDGTLWVWSEHNQSGQLGLPAGTTSDGLHRYFG